MSEQKSYLISGDPYEHEAIYPKPVPCSCCDRPWHPDDVKPCPRCSESTCPECWGTCDGCDKRMCTGCLERIELAGLTVCLLCKAKALLLVRVNE